MEIQMASKKDTAWLNRGELFYIGKSATTFVMTIKA